MMIWRLSGRSREGGNVCGAEEEDGGGEVEHEGVVARAMVSLWWAFMAVFLLCRQECVL